MLKKEFWLFEVKNFTPKTCLICCLIKPCTAWSNCLRSHYVITCVMKDYAKRLINKTAVLWMFLCIQYTHCPRTMPKHCCLRIPSFLFTMFKNRSVIKQPRKKKSHFATSCYSRLKLNNQWWPFYSPSTKHLKTEDIQCFTVCLRAPRFKLWTDIYASESEPSNVFFIFFYFFWNNAEIHIA